MKEFQTSGRPHLHLYVGLPAAMSADDFAGLRERTLLRHRLERHHGCYEGRKRTPPVGLPYGGKFGTWLRSAWSEIVGTAGPTANWKASVDGSVSAHQLRGVDVAVMFWSDEAEARPIGPSSPRTSLAAHADQGQANEHFVAQPEVGAVPAGTHQLGNASSWLSQRAGRGPEPCRRGGEGAAAACPGPSASRRAMDRPGRGGRTSAGPPEAAPLQDHRLRQQPWMVDRSEAEQRPQFPLVVPPGARIAVAAVELRGKGLPAGRPFIDQRQLGVVMFVVS